MRVVEMLPDVPLVELDGTPIKDSEGNQLHMKNVKFLLDRLADEIFTKDFDGLARGMGIRKILLNHTEGPIKLEDHDWASMCTACKRNYNSQIAHNFFGFIENMLNAKKEEPTS